MKLTIGQKYYSNGDEKIAVELRKVKKDGYFTRKPDAKTEFIRNHYNRKDEFRPASFRRKCHEKSLFSRYHYRRSNWRI